MKLENAQYVKSPITNENENIRVTIDGITKSVGMSEDNIHYVEIMKQVKEGTLTIKDAD
tara:strand:- start:7834 stop:8010 length:177 start_codon:yes stop_codon:yes gene_type:complete